MNIWWAAGNWKPTDPTGHLKVHTLTLPGGVTDWCCRRCVSMVTELGLHAPPSSTRLLTTCLSSTINTQAQGTRVDAIGQQKQQTPETPFPGWSQRTTPSPTYSQTGGGVGALGNCLVPHNMCGWMGQSSQNEERGEVSQSQPNPKGQSF